MEASITVKEKYSSQWSTITILLGALTLIFFTGFLYIDSVVWEGIMRLTAFIFFAATIFSGLKVMEGKHIIHLDIEDEYLLVSYFRDDQKVQEDIYDITEIEDVYIDRLPPTVFTNTFLFKDKTVMIGLRDSERPLNLFALSGRVLSITPSTARKVVEFISDNTEPQ